MNANHFGVSAIPSAGRRAIMRHVKIIIGIDSYCTTHDHRALGSVRDCFDPTKMTKSGRSNPKSHCGPE